MLKYCFTVVEVIKNNKIKGICNDLNLSISLLRVVVAVFRRFGFIESKVFRREIIGIGNFLNVFVIFDLYGNIGFNGVESFSLV